MPEVSTDAGFSLVELMIALAVAAIIAAFAIPSYQGYLQRSYLPEASSGLLLTGLRLEQYYQDRRSYAGDSGCGVALTLDQQGNARTTALPEGWGTVPQPCWITKRGSGC